MILNQFRSIPKLSCWRSADNVDATATATLWLPKSNLMPLVFAVRDVAKATAENASLASKAGYEMGL